MNNPLQRSVIPAGVALLSIAIVLVSSTTAAVGAPAQQTSDVDWNAVQDALGRPGTLMPGDVYRIGMPRTDLKVTVNDVQVQPASPSVHTPRSTVSGRRDGHGRPGAR
jgi:hypothetical protein